MTADTLTLAEFLRARFAEDEEAVYRADSDGAYRIAWLHVRSRGSSGWYATVASDHQDGEWCADGVNLAALAEFTEPQVVFDARRALADLEAKRCVVDALAGYQDGYVWASGEASRAAEALQALANVYADHADFRPEWRTDGVG